ncbi:MAG: hypothetical protein ABI663_16030 [Chryseolinea sp.]
MKRIILISFLLLCCFLGKSQQLFFEDFNSVADGATTGTASGTAPAGQRAWSINTGAGAPAAGSFEKRTYGGLERFTVDQTGANEGVWSTGVITIAAGKQVAIDISLVSYNAGPSDYVNAYYKLNGGPEVLFGSAIGGNYVISAGASIVLTGTSVQVVVRAKENTAGDDGAGNPNMMRFDDVEVTQITTLFSRKTGNWGDVTAGNGTWSTVALGGVSCDCAPDNTTNVIVGNSDVVSITAASSAVNVTVQNSSTLQWTAAVALNMSRGGSLTISNTASVNRNGNNGSQIIFPVAAVIPVTVNSSNANALAAGDIVVSGASTLTFSGTGSISTADDFLVTAAATIVNNLSGTFTIGDVLSLNSTVGASFTNNGPMTITGIVTINTPSTFTNNNSVTMLSQSAGVLAGTGTWTQGTNVNSLLTFAGSTMTITTFNASNTGNTVNYNRPGNATLRNPTGNTYYNLTIAGTNIKSSSADHIVNNNLAMNGASANATLDPGAFNFRVNGTSTITLGTFNDTNDTGANIFVGNVSLVAAACTFTSTTITTTANLTFRGGIANAGIFNAGGATFDTNNQAITGTTSMSFANNVAINNITVTNSNSAAFTITGTTTLSNGGYTDSDNSSIATFVGAVSQSGTSAFNTTAVITQTQLIFRGGITNNGGTFTAGGATFNTNAQSIAGASAVSFANLVVVTGIVVSNDNAASVTMSNTVAAVLSGTGTWTQNNTSTLNYAGSTLTVTTFNASTAVNTVNYNAAGNQTIRNPSSASTYYNLSASGSGTKSSSANHTVNNLSISGTAIMDPLTFNLTVNGTSTVNAGSFNDSNDTGLNTFVGNVSVVLGAIFNSTTVTTTANVVFRGGIANAGTFTGGGATFDTNAQSITGGSAISFANLVVVTGVVVTNNNTSTVSLTSNGASLSGTGTWTQGANSTLNFAGSSLTVTTFNASNAGNTVNYNSPAAPAGTAQTIRAPASTYTNLTFNNTFAASPQLTAAGSFSVTGILTMTSGNVNLNGNTLTLTSNAAGSLVHSLASGSGWVYGGPMTRTFASSTAIAVANVRGLFPMGTSADFRPFFVSVNSVANTAGTITVTHTGSATTTAVAFLDGVTPVLLRNNSSWAVSTATMSAGTWGIRYGGTGLGTVTNLSHVRSILSGSTVATHVATSTVSTSDPRVERSALSFGNLTNTFFVGSTNILSPLPIKLLYFNARVEQDEVSLNWATAQETNNDFFTIEKSSNPEQGFQLVSKLSSQGNSTIEQEYSAVDKAPYLGLSYYRLKQTDFDGTSTYSKLVSVSYEGSTLASLKIYPNPLKDQKTVKVEITGLRGIPEIPLVIYNFLGQKILEKLITVGSGGVVDEELFFEKPLATGVFVIKAGPTLQLTQRLVVE